MSSKNKNPDLRTVLVVEDDVFSSETLVGKLTLAGFKVLTARDGKSGLEMALNHHPDLILLDIIMPKMDGTTMLKKVREDKWGSTVPIIILSNISLEGRLSEEMQNQIWAYLRKTQTKLEDVVEKVKNALAGEATNKDSNSPLKLTQ